MGEVLLDRDEHMRPGTDMHDLASLKPAFAVMGDQGGFDAVALQRYPEVERISTTCITGGNSSASSTAPPRSCSGTSRRASAPA